LEAGKPWVIAILVGSTLLNAAYFLPIVYAAWFKPPVAPWPEAHRRGRFETAWPLLFPPLVTALLAVAVGLFAGTSYSPLGWTKLITDQEYLP
jgi:multicomponent Na+:H+ antiporter subunit D